MTIESAETPKTKAKARKSGSQFYYTGVLCQNGHIDVRYAHSGKCRTCVSNKGKAARRCDKTCKVIPSIIKIRCRVA